MPSGCCAPPLVRSFMFFAMLVSDGSTCSQIWFFFAWTVEHQDLPSFPTRRSSDLERREHQEQQLGTHAGRLVDAQHACRRSEEHTSELQSLRHLVCRLLLEKKKPKLTNSPTSLVPAAVSLSFTIRQPHSRSPDTVT